MTVAPITEGTGEMTLELAAEFGTSWNSGDADLVASYFAPDGEYHSSVGPEHLGISYHGCVETGATSNGTSSTRMPAVRWPRLPVVTFSSSVATKCAKKNTFRKHRP